MFCNKCGHEIPKDSIFCPECGAPVNAAPPNVYEQQPQPDWQAPDAPPPRRKKGSQVILIVLAVIALLAAGLFLLHHLQQKKIDEQIQTYRPVGQETQDELGAGLAPYAVPQMVSDSIQKDAVRDQYQGDYTGTFVQEYVNLDALGDYLRGEEYQWDQDLEDQLEEMKQVDGKVFTVTANMYAGFLNIECPEFPERWKMRQDSNDTTHIIACAICDKDMGGSQGMGSELMLWDRDGNLADGFGFSNRLYLLADGSMYYHWYELVNEDGKVHHAEVRRAILHPAG